MTNNDLIKLGFKQAPTFTVSNSVSYDLGRKRFLAAGSIGTPNEVLFICEKNNEVITDLVCVHNYDYDGVLTEEKVISLIKLIAT